MSTFPAISAYYRLAGNVAGPFPYQWLIIDGPLVLSFDGKSPHLSVLPPAFGKGFDVASSAGQPPNISLDTSYVPFRVAPPAGPGPCVDPISGIPYGTGVWAVDEGYFYFAVPAPATGPVFAREIIDGQSVVETFEVPGATAGGFVWGRTPLATTW